MFFSKYKITLSLFAAIILAFYSVEVSAQETVGEEIDVNESVVSESMDGSDSNVQEKSEKTVIKNTNNKFKSLPLADQINMHIALRKPSVLPSQIYSTFFTFNELQILRQARKGFEVNDMTGVVEEFPEEEQLASLDPGPRNLDLGGILYISNDDWTIWLNNEEVNPSSIPSEVLDLKVSKNYVEIEWLDAMTNQIYPVRLRPNQIFNLDTRLFLPGN